jgi:hypothetical protein
MEHAHDAGMLVALAAGPGTRIAVIDRFVHRNGTLYLSAESASIGSDGTVEAGLLRTETSASGARLLCVHTSPIGVAERMRTDVPIAQSYEAVLDAALLADGDGLILHSDADWIILTRTELRSALTRRRRLATKAAGSAAAP